MMPEPKTRAWRCARARHFLLWMPLAPLAVLLAAVCCVAAATSVFAGGQPAERAPLSAQDQAKLASQLDAFFFNPAPGAAPSPHPAPAAAAPNRRSPTGALLQLALNLDRLDPDMRARYASLLLRPDDSSGGDMAGAKWSAGGAYTASTIGSARFVVHYVSAPSTHAAYATAAFAQSIADEMELIATTENTTLGWTVPPDDSALTNNGGDGRYDVYLSDVGGLPSGAIFGYSSTDGYAPGAAGVAAYSYLVLDNDYSATQYGSGNALDLMKVTAAHEYNHACQFAYDASDYDAHAWFYEVTATWMEDKVYDNINDYLRFMPPFLSRTNESLRAFAADDHRPYGATAWAHYLDARYGPAIIRQIWEGTATGGWSHPSIQVALEARLAAAGTTLANEYGRFAAWLALTGPRNASGYFHDGALWPEVTIPASQRHSAYPASGVVPPPMPPQALGCTHVLLNSFGAAPVRLRLQFQGQESPNWRLWWTGLRAGEIVMEEVALDSTANGIARIDSANRYDWIVFAVSNVNNSSPIDQSHPFTYTVSLESSASASAAWREMP